MWQVAMRETEVQEQANKPRAVPTPSIYRAPPICIQQNTGEEEGGPLSSGTLEHPFLSLGMLKQVPPLCTLLSLRSLDPT